MRQKYIDNDRKTSEENIDLFLNILKFSTDTNYF